MTKRILLIAGLFLFVMNAGAQISLVPFSTGYSSPVDIKNCGDDRLFIVEQRGTIRIADTAGNIKPGFFLDIQDSVRFGGEQGLLGLAFPSDFLFSGYFYVNYTADLNGHTRISRFQVDAGNPDSAIANSEEILLSIYQPYSNHNGGHLAFGFDDYLYIGMGDGGSGGDPQNRSQNSDSLLGKMLRIDVDPAIPGYDIPPTNPYAADTTLGRPEIWATGLRNPWRFSFDRWTGDLWIGDVGQGQREEIDFTAAPLVSGLNYGWRCYEGSRVYDTSATCPPYAATVPPVYEYNHSGGLCSVTGGYRYRGARYQELYAKYFFADYCVNQMKYLEAADTGGFVFTNLGSIGGSSFSSFGEDRHGELYCSGSGTIYRIESANCLPVATINDGEDTLKDCGTGFINLGLPSGENYYYTWIYNGDTVSTTNDYTATQQGYYILHVSNQNCSNSDSVYVDFSSLTVTFTGLDSLYCVHSPAATLTPNYPGGTFFGVGMSGSTFDPSVAGPGLYNILYTYTDSYGCSYAHSQSVRVDACAGVNENNLNRSISVYPNPSGGNFTIKSNFGMSNDVEVSLSDITGRKIYLEKIQMKNGETIIPVFSELAKGIYTVRVEDDSSFYTAKVIIQ